MTDGNFVGGKSQYKYCPPMPFDVASQVWVPACNIVEHKYVTVTDKCNSLVTKVELKELSIINHKCSLFILSKI